MRFSHCSCGPISGRAPSGPTGGDSGYLHSPARLGLISAFILLWLMIVGGDRLRNRGRLEKFQMVPDGPRLYRVDQAAAELRR